MKQEGLIDFPDMLRLASRLLKEHADIRDIVKNCQRHILVDEFQDVSLAQFEVLKPLIREPVRDSSLTTVGDDDQIIYRRLGVETERSGVPHRESKPSAQRQRTARTTRQINGAIFVCG